MAHNKGWDLFQFFLPTGKKGVVFTLIIYVDLGFCTFSSIMLQNSFISRQQVSLKKKIREFAVNIFCKKFYIISFFLYFCLLLNFVEGGIMLLFEKSQHQTSNRCYAVFIYILLSLVDDCGKYLLFDFCHCISPGEYRIVNGRKLIQYYKGNLFYNVEVYIYLIRLLENGHFRFSILIG